MAGRPQHDEPRRRRAAPGTRTSDERWPEILDTAATIFAQKGYERTTVRDIAEALGMLSGSLYYYIDSKEDLLFALIQDFHETGREGIARVVAELDSDPVTGLRSIIARHVALNAQNLVRTTVFYNNFRYLSSARKEDIIRTRREHESRIEKLIRRGQDEGRLRSTVDARLSALSILSMLNSIHTWYRPDRAVTPEQLGELQADLLINGMARPDSHQG